MPIFMKEKEASVPVCPSSQQPMSMASEVTTPESAEDIRKFVNTFNGPYDHELCIDGRVCIAVHDDLVITKQMRTSLRKSATIPGGPIPWVPPWGPVGFRYKPKLTEEFVLSLGGIEAFKKLERSTKCPFRLMGNNLHHVEM